MCIAFIKRDNNKVLIALNRDEFYERPTSKLKFIEEKNAYAGLDLRHGGTWFAIDKSGRFSFVTNIRQKKLIKEDARSRGELPFSILEDGEDILAHSTEYNPFNLVWGDSQQILYYNNLEHQEKILAEPLWGISNAVDPCDWPKVTEGKKSFSKIRLDWEDEHIFNEALQVMKNREKRDFVAPNTGFDEATERGLASTFLELDGYGTVSTTVALIGADGVRIDEHKWPSGEHTKVAHRFKI